MLYQKSLPRFNSAQNAENGIARIAIIIVTATTFAIRLIFFKGILLSVGFGMGGERLSRGTARVYKDFHHLPHKTKNTAVLAVLNTNPLL